jgi:phospholipid-translocating ATPase
MVLLTFLFIILQNTEIPYIPIQFMRMLILLSTIIPISMRVNLDFAKLYYAYQINQDATISGTVVRNTNCPE